MTTKTTINTRRKPAAQLDDAWHESRANRMIVAVIVIICALLAIEVAIIAWQWIDAAMRLLDNASTLTWRAA